MRTKQAVLNNKAANESIEDGEPIASLYRLFADRDAAIAYYSAYQSRKYLPNQVGSDCCICGKPAVPLVSVVCVWRAYHGSALNPRLSDALFLLIGVLSISTRYQITDFLTGHAMCRKCFRSVKLKRAVANILQFVAMFTALLMMVAFPVAIGMCVMASTRSEWTSGLVGVLVTFTLLVGAFALYWPIMRLRLPGKLRSIGRRPFRSHSMAGVGA